MWRGAKEVIGGSRVGRLGSPSVVPRWSTSESLARAVRLPERFRGGCPFGAGGGRSLPPRLRTNLPARPLPARVPKVCRVTYSPADDRYDSMTYRRAGRSG